MSGDTVRIRDTGDYRAVMAAALTQLRSQADIAKYGAGKHGINACQNNGWNCLGNLIFAIAARLHLRGMQPLMHQLDALISELFPARELASRYSGDYSPVDGFRKVTMFNDHADTTRDEEILLVETWLVRNPS